MPIAKIINGKVAEVDRTTNQALPGWIVVAADVVCGMAFDGSIFSIPAQTPVELAKIEITRLEATVTRRREREALLTDAGKAWLANVDALIAIERAKL